MRDMPRAVALSAAVALFAILGSSASAATRPSRDLTRFVGAPEAAVTKALGRPSGRLLVRRDGAAVSLRLLYTKLAVTLVLKPQGSPALTVVSGFITGGDFRVAGVGVGMSLSEASRAIGAARRCSASNCVWQTVAGKAVATFSIGRVSSVAIVAPPVSAVSASAAKPGSFGLPASTRVIPTSEVKSASGTPSGTRTLTLGPGVAASLAPGDVLVIGITPATPYGFLGRVTSVVERGVELIVTTKPATLEDAIPQGEIQVHATYVDGNLKPTPRFRHVSGARKTNAASEPMELSGGVSTGINKSLGCGSASVDLTGNADVTPSFTFTAQWGGILHPSVQQATFKASVVENLQLTASGHAAASCTPISLSLLSRTFAPFTVWVGPVPVVFVPKLNIDLAAHATLQADLNAIVGQQLTVVGGASYNKGSFSPISSLTNTFTWQQPSPSLTATLAAGVTAKLSLLIADFVGPYVALTPSLELDVDPLQVSPTPWWTLNGKLDAGVGIHVAVLNLNWDDPHLISYERLLASGTKAAPTGGSGSGGGGSGGGGSSGGGGGSGGAVLTQLWLCSTYAYPGDCGADATVVKVEVGSPLQCSAWVSNVLGALVTVTLTEDVTNQTASASATASTANVVVTDHTQIHQQGPATFTCSVLVNGSLVGSKSYFFPA
jgi:uncharacterized membrane protein YgcG